MLMLSKASVRPSWATESIMVTLPYVQPRREPGRRWGPFDIDSCPPATTTVASPDLISRAASMIAVRPDRQILLTVTAGTSQPSPAPIAACRAGPCPEPAWTTWPMITASTSAGATPDRSSAVRMAWLPSWTAVWEESAPFSLPKAVRAPARMTTSVGLFSGMRMLLGDAALAG